MAIIYIKGKQDPIHVPNDKAAKIKQRWLGDPEFDIPKAEYTDIIDLGEWAGEYGQIKGIEIEKVESHKEFTPPRIETPEEHARTRAKIAEVGENLKKKLEQK